MSQHGCPERLSNRSKGFQEEGPSQPTMEVLVETLTGTAFEMTVSPSDTIFAIKSKICRVEGIPVSQQHLLFNLKEVEDGSSLRALGITDGARLRLVLGMRGGPISTRRLPPPPGEPWRDIERLLDTRDDGDWSSGGSGCKVTVLVFRDGERVNMLRVRENTDGTYSPIDHAKYSSSLPQLAEPQEYGSTPRGGSRAQNAVTMGKMLELRARMARLSVRRNTGDKPEIQKTRSEESLSVPSLLDDSAGDSDQTRIYTPYSEAEDTFTPLYDGNYTRYDYDCSFADRYTLLPPIGTRTESEQSVSEAGAGAGAEGERLAGPILVAARRDEPRAEPPAAPHYGPLVGGGWWRLGAGGGGGGGGSASSLSARAPRPRARAPLADSAFSSSTSDLEALRRHRLLPALSRHRPREHLHLSDPGLDRAQHCRFGDFEDRRDADPPKEEKEVKEKKLRIRCGLCKKKLSIATVHHCRCGAAFCAPHRYAEVHGCAYDYKQHAHIHLQRANPLVSAPKLPKI